MTIHKCQGLTLDQVAVHLGEKEDTPGQTFVAISRVKSLESLNIYDLNKKRIKPLMINTNPKEKWQSQLDMLKEIDRLQRLI